MFYRWLIGDMGTPGLYEYKAIHIYTTIVVFFVLTIFIILGLNKKISDKAKRNILIGISLFHIVFEILWRFIYFFVKKSSLVDLYPMYPCNLGGVIIPIIALINKNTLKQIFYVFGFVGAILTFAMPGGIFSTDVLVFPVLKSILQHTGLLLIPAFEYVSGTFKTSVKYYPFLIIGCLIHLLNAEVIDRLVLGLTGDYMYYRSGLPFVINGIPQWITFSVFGATVFYIIEFILGPKESIEFYKRIFK